MLRTPVLPDTVIEIYIYTYIYLFELVGLSWSHALYIVQPATSLYRGWRDQSGTLHLGWGVLRCRCTAANVSTVYTVSYNYIMQDIQKFRWHTSGMLQILDPNIHLCRNSQKLHCGSWSFPLFFGQLVQDFVYQLYFKWIPPLFLLNCCWPQKSARAPHPGLSFGWLLSGEMGCPACFKGVSGEAKRERYIGGHLEILLWVHTMTRFQLNIILCFAFDCWWLFLVTFVEKDIVAALDQTAPWTQGVKLPCSVSKYELGFRISTNQRWAELSRKYAKTNGAWEGKKPQGLGGKICKIRILEPYPKWILWMK